MSCSRIPYAGYQGILMLRTGKLRPGIRENCIRRQAENFVEMGVDTEGAGSVDETVRFIRDQYDIWQLALRDTGLEPQ